MAISVSSGGWLLIGPLIFSEKIDKSMNILKEKKETRPLRKRTDVSFFRGMSNQKKIAAHFFQ